MSNPIIVWFRQDLRLEDNPALWEAAQKNAPIIPLYIFNTNEKMGAAQKVWLHHTLDSLTKKIPLVLRQGDPYKILSSLQKETKSMIYTNRCYEPHELKIEGQLKELKSFKGNLLIEPWEISPKTSPYFKVFTPFWNQCLKLIEPAKSLPIPKLHIYPEKIKSDTLDSWNLLPDTPNWAKTMESYWNMEEQAAHQRLETFIEHSLEQYDQLRDMPAIDGTSRLSPYLHFGQISPRQIWHRIKGLRGSESFIRQLGWREFSYHLLYHFPSLPESPFNDRFNSFEWEENKQSFKAWTKGLTGFPIVDAGMRQLWELGWMHNRVRMIVASFLTKDLLIPWQKGAEWFWDTLVDADLANNSASWQWVAGCGADAAPYFRIFNPVLQSQKFDPEGEYIKRWVPELKHLDKHSIHQPWTVKNLSYPKPIVEHKKAREEALKRYKKTKNT